MRFWPILGHFWRSVVTLVSFSSNISNFEKNANIIKKSKNPKMSKNPKKIPNIPKTKKNLSDCISV